MKPSGGIDWSVLHERMRKAQDVCERSGRSQAVDVQKVLRDRARQLAKEPAETEAGDSIELLEFMLAHERYGIGFSYVREIVPLKEYTPVPGTPPFIIGVINIRSRVVSITDIRRFFDLPEKGITDLNKVLILESETMEFGILADAILGMRSRRRAEVQAMPSTTSGVRSEYVSGVTADGVIILDALSLLADRRLVVEEDGENERKS